MSAKELVTTWQLRLSELGYDVGTVDGVWGPRTDSATTAFKAENGLAARPYPGPITMKTLASDNARPSPKPRTPDAPSNEPPWVTVARKYLGLKEVPGPGNNPTIVGWWAYIGATWFVTDATPWCGAFIGATLKEAGFKILSGAEAPRALAWESYGRGLSKPAVGCIATKTRSGGGHVFYIIGVSKDGRFVGLGGNQADSVSIALFNRSDITAYRWPMDGPEPNYNLPVLDAKGVPVSSKES